MKTLRAIVATVMFATLVLTAQIVYAEGESDASWDLENRVVTPRCLIGEETSEGMVYTGVAEITPKNTGELTTSTAVLGHYLIDLEENVAGYTTPSTSTLTLGPKEEKTITVTMIMTETEEPPGLRYKVCILEEDTRPEHNVGKCETVNLSICPTAVRINSFKAVTWTPFMIVPGSLAVVGGTLWVNKRRRRNDLQ